MSDRAPGRAMRRMLAGAALSFVAVGAAGAQSAAEYRSRLDGLETRWRAAKASVDSAERARRSVAGSMTVERGQLRIVVDSALAHYVVAAADSAARAIDATFGARARLLADHPIVVRRHAATRTGDTTLIGVVAGGRMQTLAPGDSAAIHAQLLTVFTGTRVAAPLHAALDDTLRRWFAAALPAGPESRAELIQAHLELITASTDISRRCLAGDMEGCRQFLLLSPVADPLVEGYTSAFRHAIVKTNTLLLRRPATAAEFDRCVTALDDTACIARLRELPADAMRGSISGALVRRSFARSVLVWGGEGAYPRLAESATLPLDARFALAGGRPIDSLVAAWRTSVVAASPRPSSVPPATGLATLAWIAACGALALRSSRWR